MARSVWFLLTLAWLRSNSTRNATTHFFTHSLTMDPNLATTTSAATTTSTRKKRARGSASASLLETATLARRTRIVQPPPPPTPTPMAVVRPLTPREANALFWSTHVPFARAKETENQRLGRKRRAAAILARITEEVAKEQSRIRVDGNDETELEIDRQELHDRGWLVSKDISYDDDARCNAYSFMLSWRDIHLVGGRDDGDGDDISNNDDDDDDDDGGDDVTDADR